MKKTIHGTSGFTLVEILLAMVLISIAVIPMMEAVSPGRTSTGGEEATVFTNQARGTLNRVAAIDYGVLDNYVDTYSVGTVNLTNLFTLAGFTSGATEAALENFTFKGTGYTPSVTIADFSAGAGGLYELTVTVEYVTLKTLKAEY